MYLDLMDVLRSPGNTTQKPISIAPTTLDDLEIVEPVKGEVRAVNARQNIVVSGEATTAIEMNCARCLRPFPQPLQLELEAVAPVSFFSASGGESNEDGEADDELAALFDAHSVDVLELVRQAAELQAPIQPLCSPDCPGLPEASHYVETVDERWNSLKKWADSQENGH